MVRHFYTAMCVLLTLTMMGSSQVVCSPLVAATKSSPTSTKKQCGCSNASLCDPLVGVHHDKEIFSYATNPHDWPFYNWSMMTTIVHYSAIPHWPMYCHAKSLGIKMITAAPIGGMLPPVDLPNEAKREAFVNSTMTTLQTYGWDGVHLDYETSLGLKDLNETEGLSLAVGALAERIRATLPGGGQMSFAVGWIPATRAWGNAQERYYNYTFLMETLDFLMIMDYDVSWCPAGPNSPAFTALQSIPNYLKLVNDTSKLILGLPWYGHQYPCINNYTGPETKCQFQNHGDCTTEYNYPQILSILEEGARSGGGIKLLSNLTVNMTMAGRGSWARFEYVDKSKPEFPWNQIWFDTPATLKQKYLVAKKYNIRGVSMWNLDSIDYSNTTKGAQQRVEFWDALSAFL